MFSKIIKKDRWRNLKNFADIVHSKSIFNLFYSRKFAWLKKFGSLENIDSNTSIKINLYGINNNKQNDEGGLLLFVSSAGFFRIHRPLIYTKCFSSVHKAATRSFC